MNRIEFVKNGRAYNALAMRSENGWRYPFAWSLGFDPTTGDYDALWGDVVQNPEVGEQIDAHFEKGAITLLAGQAAAIFKRKTWRQDFSCQPANVFGARHYTIIRASGDDQQYELMTRDGQRSIFIASDAPVCFYWQPSKDWLLDKQSCSHEADFKFLADQLAKARVDVGNPHIQATLSRIAEYIDVKPFFPGFDEEA